MTNSVVLKAILKHAIIIIGFVCVALLYFNPVLKGETIFQSDIQQYLGMAKQQSDFREQTGKETYWTNSAFGGMPTYQLGAKYPHNYIKKLDHALRFLPRPADYLFLYFLGFYIFLLSLKVNYKLAGVGALAFGFSTYLIIILGVGHNSKAHAIAYMPLVLSGILLVFRKRYILGTMLTTVALGLELSANHFQMTYYLLLAVIVMGVVFLIQAVKQKTTTEFFKAVGLLVLPVIFAIGLNATTILTTQEYVKESTRGLSELTISPEGTPLQQTSGLSKDYITEYSYGLVEAFNLFIPRFMGGGSFEMLNRDSETYKFFIRLGASPVQAAEAIKRVPTYWGDQPIVEAPAYIGAVVIFLFILALYLVKGSIKNWLIAAIILSFLLSLGKNFSLLTNLFIDYVPLYNKFRAVSSIQVILELAIPALAILGLKELINSSVDFKLKQKALKYSLAITAGICIVFLLFKSALFDFSGANDGIYIQNYGQQFIDAVKKDRKQLFNYDTIRTLLFILASGGLVFLFIKSKINSNRILLGFAILIVIDLVSVDRRYVNNTDFVSKTRIENPFIANSADKYILNDSTYFRVLDVTSGGARASYFHNSLGGYHAAKLRRFNELNEYYIQNNNLEVINMLNTKYIISPNKEGQPAPYLNTDANGAAWFIKNRIAVPSANAEFKALDTLNTKINAVFNGKKFETLKAKQFNLDSLASVTLVKALPNELIYKTSNLNDGFAVFSEIYYPHGWQVNIDNKAATMYRVNYALRGLNIPSGEHTVHFKFEPEVVKTGSQIALGSSIIVFVLLILGSGFLIFKLK